MVASVIARFLVDHSIGPGAVRAILDTLAAQGGAYEPQLVLRPPDESLRRITGARPARLLDDVGEGGTSTTFLRVSEGRAHPVLSFSVSDAPRISPTSVTLTVPEEALVSSKEIEQILGICKGLYLFLESPWGTVGIPDPADRAQPGNRSQAEVPASSRLEWANFLGPHTVAQLGPARLLTSMAFIVEILSDGGIMLVTHPSPRLAASPEGLALRRQIGEAIGLDGVTDGLQERRVLMLSTRRRGGVVTK